MSEIEKGDFVGEAVIGRNSKLFTLGEAGMSGGG